MVCRLSVFLLFIVLLAGCGNATANAITIQNSDPRASLVSQQMTLTPPAGWSLTGDGRGITDGIFVITVTTLTGVPADDTTLRSMNGTFSTGTRNVVIGRQSETGLAAWFLLNDTLLTSVQMQSRTPVDFTTEHETMLLTVARSVKVGP
ncbi:MAG: hypothetical protein AAFU54_16330 [Chloroflexota bacterium]